MFMIGKVGEQEPHYTPLSFIINTNTSYQTVCIVQYCNHVLLGRYGSSKRREFYSFFCILP